MQSIGSWMSPVLLLCLGAPLAAQQAPTPIKEERPGLAAQAKITPDSARKAALHRVRGGAIASEEIEKEHGKLIYTFDIKLQGKEGIEEVQVDALTGAVLAVEHEDPDAAAREAAGEKPKSDSARRP